MRNTTGKYILKGTKAVPEPDLFKWGEWMEKRERVICQNHFEGKIMVSTAFLGLDHDYYGDPDQVGYQPLIYETMIFGGEHDMFMDRYRTYEEAVAGHHRALDMIKEKAV